MVYSFARVSAIVGMNAKDYYPNGKKYWFRLHEKGGKFHEVPAHHNAEAYMDAYIVAAGIDTKDKAAPLFRTFRGQRTDRLTEKRMNRVDVFRMIRKRALQAGLNAEASCHTFRATGITAYLKSGGTLENAQAIAAHESPRTTKLYDRTQDAITLDEVEKIQI
jgi:integrase